MNPFYINVAHGLTVASQTAIISSGTGAVDDQISAHVGTLVTWGISIGVLSVALVLVLGLVFKPFRALLSRLF